MQPKDLCRSHIIPEFLYEPLYDEKHRLEMLSVLPHKGDWYEQKGLHEKLLCFACEQKISAWETYGRAALRGGVLFEAIQAGNLVQVKGIDYKKFKLFLLSILWRASVSSLQFFERVELGKHNEILRSMLLEENPGTPVEYPCVLFGLRSPTGVMTDLIMQPERLQFQGHRAYRFVFGGFLWAFMVSSHKLPALVERVAVSPDGHLSVLLRPPEEIRPLISFAEKHKQMGRS